MKDHDLDRLLSRALSQQVKPSAELIERVKYQWIKREEEQMNKATKFTCRTAVLAAVLVMLLVGSALAAVALLKPTDVATQLGNSALSQAFAGSDAVIIDEAVEKEGHRFTLLGMLYGQNLNDLNIASDTIQPERLYAVLAIQRTDGAPMTIDESGASVYVSPLVEGLRPWMVNMNTLNGAFSEIIVDGIAYRIIDCDDVSMFADRDIYLCVSDSVPNSNSFSYDEATGAITANEDYSALNALFTLPIDASKADPIKASALLKQIDYDDSPIEATAPFDGHTSINSSESTLELTIEE